MSCKKILYAFTFCSVAMMEAQTPIVTEWSVQPTDSTVVVGKLTLPISSAVKYKYVKVGDPTVTGEGTASSNIEIDMPSNGNYIVSFEPLTSDFRFFIDPQKAYKLNFLKLTQWGDYSWNSDLTGLFRDCSNLTITATDVPNFSNVTNMSSMFIQCSSLTTIPNIGQWDVSKVSTFAAMFSGASKFNDDISTWKTSSATIMADMFNNAFAFNSAVDYNPTTGAWDVSKVVNMSRMFYGATVFDQPLNNWNTSNVKNMSNMFFSNNYFDQPLDHWDTGNVTDMSYMFARTKKFNQDITGWDTKNVKNMTMMFYGTYAFNQEIGSWDTSKVTDMSSMFGSASKFNGNIDLWDTSSVTNMNAMFMLAPVFNQAIGTWNTNKVTNMANMFRSAKAFNQNLENWNLSSLTSASGMFDLSGMDCANYGKTLRGWSLATTIPNGITLGAQGVPFGEAIGGVARTTLSAKSWSFVGDVSDPGCDNKEIVMRWNATANGDYNDAINIRIPANMPYNYRYVKADNPAITGSGVNTATNWKVILPEQGEYIVYVEPTAANFRFLKNNNMDLNSTTATVGSRDRAKLLELIRWSNNTWESDLSYMFWGYPNLKVTATDVPIFSNVTNMSNMFENCTALTAIPNANLWDVSKVTTMEMMFQKASNFNEDISEWKTSSLTNTSAMFNEAFLFNSPLNTNVATGAWDMSKVTDISSMFHNAAVFNQPLDAWDTSKVTTTKNTFSKAIVFDQPLNTWVTSNVTDMSNMFNEANAFNQPLHSWDVSKVTTLARTFNAAKVFNQNLSTWNTSNVKDFSSTFASTDAFNSDITTWDTSNGTNMTGMFSSAKVFNQPIGAWVTSNVKQMGAMFRQAEKFNQPIGMWDVSKVNMTDNMFRQAKAFNQPLNSWNTSSFVSMKEMFLSAESFNQPLDNWNVNLVKFMTDAFKSAYAFNQNLGSWKLNSNVAMGQLLSYTAVDCLNYSLTLKGWLEDPNGPVGVSLGAYTVKYGTTFGEQSRAALINDKGWTINDQGANGDCDSVACFKPGVTTGVSISAKQGITALGRAGSEDNEWPHVRKGAWMVLESKTKGLVINRVPFTSLTTPKGMPSANYKKGMMLYDTTNNALKIYDGTTWKSFNKPACPN